MYVLSFLTLCQPLLTSTDLLHRFEDMNRALATHQIKPLIDTVFSFEEATAAYKHLESQKHIGKVVIRVASN